jgi:hypothetical protein
MQCLKVRSVQYDSRGLKTEVGPWQLFYTEIEGYRHEPGVRNVLRVQRYERKQVPADASLCLCAGHGGGVGNRQTTLTADPHAPPSSGLRRHRSPLKSHAVPCMAFLGAQLFAEVRHGCAPGSQAR